MLELFLSLIIASLVIQIPNFLGASNEAITLWYSIKMSLITIPISIIATASYVYFFGKGIELFSFTSLTIMTKVGALVFALIVQLIWFNKSMNIVELSGILIVVLGFLIITFNEDINNLL